MSKAPSAASLDGLLQCPQCHHYVPESQSRCSFCDNVMPKTAAMRQARARELPADKRRERAAYERYKQELTHVPAWLRKLVDTFTYLYTQPLAHRIVQWGSGLLAFGLAFSAAEALRGFIPPDWAMKGMSFIGLQVILGCAAFMLASRFVFAIFQKNVEAMLGVWGEEEDVRILQGQLQQQYLDNLK